MVQGGRRNNNENRYSSRLQTSNSNLLMWEFFHYWFCKRKHQRRALLRMSSILHWTSEICCSRWPRRPFQQKIRHQRRNQPVIVKNIPALRENAKQVFFRLIAI